MMVKPRIPRFSKRSRVNRLKGLPDRETLLKFLQEAGKASKADIARAFGLKGEERRALRTMLRNLELEGRLDKHGLRGFSEAGAFPVVGVANVIDRDADGELFVRLTKGSEKLPSVRLAPNRDDATGPAPGIGDMVLVRFERPENGQVEARLLKSLGQSVHRMLGVIRRGGRDVWVESVDRRSTDSLVLYGADARKLKEGDLVSVRVETSTRKYGRKRGKLLEILGREDDPRAASMIAISSHSIPTGFTSVAEVEAEAALLPTLSDREDLRDIPFVTIDPISARDHDDAVFAHADPETKNAGGWIVWVAIADVAAYVRTGTALDNEARIKGNSVYFPDRVEPMLPERLSNGLCSLREGENRACLAVRMVFDKAGRKIAHRFVRGLMRSAAKLSYEQVQNAVDGRPDDKASTLLNDVLMPLWNAYHVMLKGRHRRSSLAIESMERDIVFSDKGTVASITPRASLEANGLIEEMMIQANVSAAETLDAKRVPLIYRIHAAPSQEKIHTLAEFLGTLGISWNKCEPTQTHRFNQLLDETRGGPHSEIVNEVVLRSQMQAQYSSNNIGHFGLNLASYPRFTSPIRRYGDLIVHRALIRALELGADGLTNHDISQLEDLAERISFTERRAATAERDATDRYVASFLVDQVGANFHGRITGVTRFGLFVRLSDTGASGLVPISGLASEYFVHDERLHALVGERTGARWPLGMVVEVRLREAIPVTGGLLFEMLGEPASPDHNHTAPRPKLIGRRQTERKGTGNFVGRRRRNKKRR